MINVLFVCLGNICRSPMADGVFQNLVKEAGLGSLIEVDSAGTGSWHVGERPHRGTQNILKKHNIPYNGRARQYSHRDADQFDYILTMDRQNLADVLRLIPEAPDADGVIARDGRQIVVRPFLSYAQEAGLVQHDEVPDPYYTGAFDETYDLVLKGCRALLDHIRQTYNI
jgi:protein-tyrosine phosphatase